ncbi:ORF430 [White spot syndrome virus]|uniref:ORF430 n=1 Tax=White spot syndrome virus TaxID=342409 RepID=A0A2D3I6Z1_9VIRU|nr:ORF430 [White spot syndrome virus]
MDVYMILKTRNVVTNSHVDISCIHFACLISVLKLTLDVLNVSKPLMTQFLENVPQLYNGKWV